MQIEKVEIFKKLINFDATIRVEKAVETVNIIWPEMLKAPGLDKGKWMVTTDNTWRSGNGVAREWVLRRSEEQISIVIFASSDGPGTAQKFFLSRATENMMIDSPFVKGPDGLGTLAVTMQPEAPPNLIWIFRNLCFDVRSDNSQVDILAIAHWLQSTAEAGVVRSGSVRQRLPELLYVSSRQVEMDTPIDIRVQVTAPEEEVRYMIDLEFDKHTIEVMSKEYLSAQIRGRAIGQAAIDFFLIDKETLQLEYNNIKFEFLPPSNP